MARYEDRIGELEAKAARQERGSGPDHSADGREQPEPSGTPEVIKRGERSEGASVAGDPSDAADQADKSDIEGLANTPAGIEGSKDPAKTERKVFTPENVTAAGTGIALGQSIASIFYNVPPEVGVGAAGVALAGAVMETKVREVFRKIRRKD
ncbi:MAG TPA: hypothetical protein VG142_01735 [Trebonia sp.]|jgi:hypothetical protein|nr:hypothetical protein [Trebonia sp.]